MQLGWCGVHVFVAIPNIKTSSSIFSPKAGMQGVIVWNWKMKKLILSVDSSIWKKKLGKEWISQFVIWRLSWLFKLWFRSSCKFFLWFTCADGFSFFDDSSYDLVWCVKKLSAIWHWCMSFTFVHHSSCCHTEWWLLHFHNWLELCGWRFWWQHFNKQKCHITRCTVHV